MTPWPRRPLPRLTDRLPLGRSGLRVSPVCLGATPAADTVLAAFDAGINFFFVSADLHWPIYEGTRRGLEALLARGGGVRDDIVVAAVSYVDEPLFQSLQLHEVIAAVRGLQRIDLMIAGAVSSPASWYPRLATMARARAAGHAGARAIGGSFHDRVLALSAAAFEAVDIVYVRYNTAHPGARREVLDLLRPDRSVLVYNFKSTMFQVTREMFLALGLRPEACWLPAVPDYYRFALSRPQLNGILASPSTPEEVAALAAALDRGALLPEEEEHMMRLSSLAWGAMA
jgi:hypothetical protein